MRRQLHAAEVVARREVGVEPPAEILVERLRAVDVGNADHHDFELHVDRFGFCEFCSFHKSSYEFPAIVEKYLFLLSCPSIYPPTALSPILRLQTINFRSKKSKVRFVECEHPQTLRPLLPTR